MSSAPSSATTSWPAGIIPLHYHYNMLTDVARMDGFTSAIQLVVKPGMRVLELGGGSAILSFLAAQQGAKVYCVEIEPSTAAAAREILRLNGVTDRVEVINASALDYLPPERVDVVICEMVHVGMLREKQLEVMDSFRTRYLEKFGAPLPIFLPFAAILAVQPVHQDFNFYGYEAPMPAFQHPHDSHPRTKFLGEPAVTHMLDYSAKIPERITWRGPVAIKESGTWNAIRFITKNVLAADQSVTPPRLIDWFCQYLVLPLPQPLTVQAGESYEVAFDYPHGAEIFALQCSLQVTRSPAAFS